MGYDMTRIHDLCGDVIRASTEATKGKDVSRQEIIVVWSVILRDLMASSWNDAPNDDIRIWLIANAKAFFDSLPWAEKEEQTEATVN